MRGKSTEVKVTREYLDDVRRPSWVEKFIKKSRGSVNK